MDKRQKVVMIGGIPGSGKTSLGLKLHHDLGLPLYDIDSLYPNTEREQAWSLFKQRFTTSVLLGNSGIYVATFRMPQTRTELLLYARNHNYDTTAVFFDYKPEDVEHRSHERSIRIPSHPVKFNDSIRIPNDWYAKFQLQDNTDLDKQGWIIVNDPEIGQETIAQQVENRYSTITENKETASLSRIGIERH